MFTCCSWTCGERYWADELRVLFSIRPREYLFFFFFLWRVPMAPLSTTDPFCFCASAVALLIPGSMQHAALALEQRAKVLHR